MDKRIVFFVTSAPIRLALQQELDQMNCRFPVVEISMEKTLQVARQYVERGAKVVVCNGSTAAYLKDKLHCYIVEIPYSSIELIAAVREGRKLSDKIAIVGFESLVQAGKQIQPLFDVALHTELVFRENDMENAVKRLAGEGFRVFIGGTTPVTAARQVGAVGIYIDINIQNIRHAIQESLRIMQLQAEKEARFEATNSILNCVSEGVIGVDINGIVNEINANALSLLHKERAGVINRSLKEILPGIRIEETLDRGLERFGEVSALRDNLLSINCVPISLSGEITGAVLTLHESRHIQSMEVKIRQKILAKGHVAKKYLPDILGRSALMENTRRNAVIFAQTDSTVLISGETGTGKELFAQSIHNMSKRAKKPFVAVNCASLPENLLESELFGYVKGAFTGANPYGKVGLFEQAHTGTVFLDEVSELSLPSQTRLLRVLQEKEVFRLGDDKIIPVDIRIIAATNKDLYRMVQEQKFREDLYFRLSVLILEIPPLRRRKKDLDEHAAHIVAMKSKSLGRQMKPLAQEGLDLLRAYDWPGNIRELENVLERAIVMSPGDEIDKLAEAMQSCRFSHPKEESGAPAGSFRLEKIESEAIRAALKETAGNRALAAKRLGISPATLWRKLKQIQS